MNTAADSMSVPKGWVTLAAIGLIVAAIAGAVLGVERSLGAHDLPSDSDTVSSVPNVTNAKPLVDSATDDAHIRSVVREEVAAALKSAKPAAPKPTAPKADDDGTSASDATAALNAAASKATTSDGGPAKPAKPAAARTAPAAASPYPPSVASPN